MPCGTHCAAPAQAVEEEAEAAAAAAAVAAAAGGVAGLALVGAWTPRACLSSALTARYACSQCARCVSVRACVAAPRGCAVSDSSTCCLLCARRCGMGAGTLLLAQAKACSSFQGGRRVCSSPSWRRYKQRGGAPRAWA
jgi:hypothetical protein